MELFTPHEKARRVKLDEVNELLTKYKGNILGDTPEGQVDIEFPCMEEADFFLQAHGSFEHARPRDPIIDFSKSVVIVTFLDVIN